MSFRVISVILCLSGYSYASWLCPVYRVDNRGRVEEETSDNLAVLKSWYATIQQVHVQNASMSDYATWDYAVCENLVLIPPVAGCDIFICLDLGTCPELSRELDSFRINGAYNRNLDFKPFREFSRNSISVSISNNIST